jgi:excisionase family DNA binding protein
MTLQTLFDEIPQGIAAAPLEQLAAVMAQLAACQSAVAARLVNGHQHGAAQRDTASAEHGALLTIAQVARRLNVPKSNAYELVRQHKLEAVHLGKYVRVDPEVLAHYVATLAASSPPAIMSNRVTRKR